MSKTTFKWTAVLAVAALALAACGKDKKSSSNESTTTAAQETTTTAEATTTTAAGPTRTMAVSKTTGLVDGDVVQVTGEGFTPGKTLGVTECADKGTDTTGDDCNLGAIGPTAKPVGPDGKYGPVDVKVSKGPFGANQIMCGQPDPCLLSLGELAEGDVERADNTVELSFG